MEILIKIRQASNKNLGFLHVGHPLNPYYNLVLGQMKIGRYRFGNYYQTGILCWLICENKMGHMGYVLKSCVLTARYLCLHHTFVDKYSSVTAVLSPVKRELFKHAWIFHKM